MKEIIDILSDKKIFLKSFEEIKLSSLNSRKKIKIYLGVTQKQYYIVVFVINQKSRILLKSSVELEELVEKLMVLKNHNFKHKIFIVSSPLCSKAKSFLEQERWKISRIEDDTV